MAQHILLVDDDALLRRSLTLNLEKAGYRVSTAANGEDAVRMAVSSPPDLVLLDIGLPGMDGLETLRQFRQRAAAPVIFLTARRRELDEVVGLELGADDYVTKPFDIDVLLAHIRAVLRRSQPTPVLQRDPVRIGDLTVDPEAHEVRLAGRAVSLAPREFDLLLALASEPGRAIPVDDLLRRVWGPEYAGEPQVVYVHIRWLREKIEVDPQHPRRILTVRGIGYRLVPAGHDPAPH